jgi:hypothetical protein
MVLIFRTRADYRRAEHRVEFKDLLFDYPTAANTAFSFLDFSLSGHLPSPCLRG